MYGELQRPVGVLVWLTQLPENIWLGTDQFGRVTREQAKRAHKVSTPEADASFKNLDLCVLC